LGGLFGVVVLVMKHGFAGKLDLVAFLANAFDQNLLAFLKFIANVANAAIGDFRNV